MGGSLICVSKWVRLDNTVHGLICGRAYYRKDNCVYIRLGELIIGILR